jgi:hypothetical protein
MYILDCMEKNNYLVVNSKKQIFMHSHCPFVGDMTHTSTSTKLKDPITSESL